MTSKVCAHASGASHVISDNLYCPWETPIGAVVTEVPLCTHCAQPIVGWPDRGFNLQCDRGAVVEQFPVCTVECFVQIHHDHDHDEDHGDSTSEPE